MWLLWFLVTIVYVSLLVLIVVGVFAGSIILSVLAAVGLVAYSIIRSLTPTNG
jgi:hypothetical protein